MRFKRSIRIPIYVYSKDEMNSVDAGIETDGMGFSETEERAFWVVDYACPHRDMEETTVFWVGGQDYITPCKFEDFEKFINNHIKKIENEYN